jgi:hypothetical protein
MKCTVFTRRLSLLSVAATIGMFAALAGNAAQAALTWYDGISLTDGGGDYVADAPLNGTSGGSDAGSGTPFFSGNWVADNPGDAASLWLSGGTGLSRPGLTQPVVGGAATNPTDFDCCVFGRTGRLFASPWGGFTDPDGTFYMGFLANLGTGVDDDPHHRTIEFHDGGFADDPNLTLELGIRGFTGGRTMEIIVRDSVTNPTGSIAGGQAFLSENARLANLSVQGTHYVVLKFEMSTSVDDVISVFLDPVGDVEPTPSASVSVGQFLADRMTLAHFSFTGAQAGPSYDEFRVGSAFADVGINTLPYDGTVVPEPASLCLLGMSVCGLVLFGRRK